MMDFVFLLPEGQEGGSSVFIGLRGHFLSTLLLPLLCLRQEVGGTRTVTSAGSGPFWKPLCAHFLKEVEGNMFESRQL